VDVFQRVGNETRKAVILRRENSFSTGIFRAENFIKWGRGSNFTALGEGREAVLRGNVCIE